MCEQFQDISDSDDKISYTKLLKIILSIIFNLFLMFFLCYCIYAFSIGASSSILLLLITCYFASIIGAKIRSIFMEIYKMIQIYFKSKR